MGTDRQFDVIVWGATGFTGQLVVEYLTKQYGTDGSKLRWAMAGRNESKLQSVRDNLEPIDPGAKDLTMLLGDSNNHASLRELARQTKVMCTTVGPYAKYGSALVKACVEEQTHYCDLTGETPWIRQMIDAHHDEAQANQCRIVNCCGFDSIPSDLGVLALQDAMLERHGVRCDYIKGYAGKMRGGASGGTIASMLNIMEMAKDKAVRRQLVDPYSLYPQGEPKGKDKRDQTNVRWDEELKMWTSPFVMAGINTRIVRRSNALLDFAYGRDFRYDEFTGGTKGFKGWWRSSSMTWGMGAFMLLAINGVTRNLLASYVLPKPGEGPSKELQEKGYFNFHLQGKTGEHTLHARVFGPKDPGYGATAMMLAEAAVCLATQEDELPKRYGIMTPASAMGQHLIKRLNNIGVTFEVDDKPLPPRK
jgi:short subunit dehydrogenase-like uncharacterized protein